MNGNQIEQIIEEQTLDQPGTRPFHLKATFAPSFERDKASNRAGTIEVWWQSPSLWREELRTGDLSQTVVSNAGVTLQQASSVYVPSWASKLELAIVKPFPADSKQIDQNLTSAEVHQSHFSGKNGPVEQTNIKWTNSDAANTPQGRSQVFLIFTNDHLSFSMGTGWSGSYSDFKDFHGRNVARTIDSGSSPQLTAKIVLLEELKDADASFFDLSLLKGATPLVRTVAMSESDLRKNLISGSDNFSWPTVINGPFDGVVWTEIVVDKNGKVQEVSTPISDNPLLKDAAAKGFASLVFSPFTTDGNPVQATGRFSVRFHVSRPAGAEELDSARNYFNKAREVSFAEKPESPSSMHASFQVSTPGGTMMGKYFSIWVDPQNWLRKAEANGSEVLVGRKDGKRLYSASGPDNRTLSSVVSAIYPLPDDDTLTESDYRIRRVDLDGSTAIRVTRALEDPNGNLYPNDHGTYWFDDAGHLLKCNIGDAHFEPSAYEDFHGAKVPRHIRLMKDNTVWIEADITSVGD